MARGVHVLQSNCGKNVIQYCQSIATTDQSMKQPSTDAMFFLFFFMLIFELKLAHT